MAPIPPIPPSVCVFCGARPGQGGDHGPHMQTARALGAGLAAQGLRLVYGAGDRGLMGAVADAVHAAGGNSLGVVPRHLLGRETGLSGQVQRQTPPVITETMHERKKVMFVNSDAIVVLPGGAGTLDEFFEVLTWAQLGLHAKPILLCDTDGYWQPLTGLIDHVIAQGFAEPGLRALYSVHPDSAATLAALRAHFNRLHSTTA